MPKLLPEENPTPVGVSDWVSQIALPYCVLDSQGIIKWRNAAFDALLIQLFPDRFTPNWIAILTKLSGEKFARFFKQGLAGTAPFHVTLPIQNSPDTLELAGSLLSPKSTLEKDGLFMVSCRILRHSRPETPPSTLKTQPTSLSQMVEDTTLGLYFLKTDLEGAYTYLGNRFKARFGIDESWLGKNSLAHIIEADHPACYTAVIQATSEVGVPQTVQLRKPLSDGSYVTTQWEFTAIADEFGSPLEIACLGVDITESLRYQQDYEALVQHMQDSVFNLDIEGKIRYVSSDWNLSYGYTHEDTVGKSLSEFVPQEERSVLIRYLQELCMGSPQESITHQLLAKNGETHWIETRGKWIPGTQSIVLVSRNITAQKETQSAIQQNERILEAVGELSNIGGWVLYPESNSVIWTRQTYQINEVDSDYALTLDSALSFYLEPDRKILIAALEQAKATGEIFDLELQICTAKGNLRTVRVLGYANLEGKKVLSLSGSIMDVTEQKLADQKIRDNEERLRLLTDNMEEAFWLRSADNQEMLYVSPAYEKVWGKTREALYQNPQDFLENIYPEDLPKVRSALKVYSETGYYEMEYRIIHPEKGVRWVWARQQVTRNDEGEITHHVGIASDITARINQQTQISLLQSVVSHAKDAIVITKAEPIDRETGGPEIIYVNEAFAHMTGYTVEEVIGKTPRILQGEGSDRATLDRLRRAMENWETHEVELINYKKDGTPFWTNFVVTPIADENGWFTHWVSIQRDITQRKEQEFELVRAKNLAEKASQAKSEFLSTMSHEIRTPLNAVIGMTGLLTETELTEEQIVFVNTIRQGGESLLSVINDILDYSQIESGQIQLENEVFSLFQPVEETMEMLVSSARNKQLELIFHPEGNLPKIVRGDITRLRQILVNLVNNAIKFTEHGEVAVHLRALESPTEKVLLEFRVRDTGIGIPPEKFAVLFQSFSQVDASIRRKHGGSGLGLAISQKLVALQGGEIRVKSKEGEGSEFTFTIQVERVAETEAEAKEDFPMLKGRVIWVIDPHPSSLDLQTRLLTHRGANVVPLAASPSTTAASATDLPELIVLDHRAYMHHQAYWQTFNRERPDIPIIWVGYAKDLPKGTVKGIFSKRMSKPLRLPQYIETLDKVLARRLQSVPSSASQSATYVDLSTFSILLVEDNPLNVKVALRMLQKFQAKVEIAHNGQEAVDIVRTIPFDLILMDMQMPVMDGITATKLIRAMTDIEQPIISAMTANAAQSDQDRCMEAGMDDFITKPIKLNILKQYLQKWLVPRNTVSE